MVSASRTPSTPTIILSNFAPLSGLFVEEVGVPKLRDVEKQRRQSRKIDSPPMGASDFDGKGPTSVSPAVVRRERPGTGSSTKSSEHYEMKPQYEWERGYTSPRDVKF